MCIHREREMVRRRCACFGSRSVRPPTTNDPPTLKAGAGLPPFAGAAGAAAAASAAACSSFLSSAAPSAIASLLFMLGVGCG